MNEEIDKLLDSLNEIEDKEIAKQLEEIIKVNKDGENFIINLSHDLRTPINIIISVVQLLLSRDNIKKDLKTVEYLDILRRNSYKLLKLANNMVDAAKISNNCYKIHKENIEVISFIENLIISIDKYAKQKNIDIIFDTNKEEVIIGIDPDALDRILINIISNSIKYSKENTSIFVNVFAKNDYINIHIKDSGRGISSDKLELIFNRYEQAEDSDSKMGSGIGLDLVKGLVYAQNGKIDIASVINVGTEMILKFPNKKEVNIRESKKMNSDDKIQQLEIEFSDIYL
ncbi:MAG: sensor histidine kinase [Clostridium sp.]|uniref:sensor histidine kinase n=1 Tax=Clostridium chrysemydis TaxID=2665504 RepID=UPI003EE66222